MTVLPPLPTDIAAQRFVTAPGETVLGFTDPAAVQRTLPVTDGEEPRDVPPVVWRTGARSTEPHLLVVGQPGSGTTTLLRSIALQALQHGDVLIVEGSGTGEYACLTGRDGVLAVECGLAGALASLEWAAHETERRLIAANRARQAGHAAAGGHQAPAVDPAGPARASSATSRRPTAARIRRRCSRCRCGTAGRPTSRWSWPSSSTALEALSEAVRQHTRARVVLGPATPEQVEAVLGAPPHTTPAARRPARPRLRAAGHGPGHRLQVPGHPGPVRRRDERGAPAGGAGAAAGADDAGRRGADAEPGAGGRTWPAHRRRSRGRRGRAAAVRERAGRSPSAAAAAGQRAEPPRRPPTAGVRRRTCAAPPPRRRARLHQPRRRGQPRRRLVGDRARRR